MKDLSAAEKHWLRTIDNHTFIPLPPPQLEAAKIKALVGSEVTDGKPVDTLWGISIDKAKSPNMKTLRLTYPAYSADERIIFVLDTVTHMHKNDMTPLMLHRIEIEGNPMHAGVFHVPADILSTAGILRTSQYELNAISERSQWHALFSRTEPLTESGIVLPSHVTASVIDAARNALKLLPPADSSPELVHTSFVLSGLTEPVQLSLYTPTAPEHLVIVLDGDQYLANGMFSDLKKTSFFNTTTVLFLWTKNSSDRAKLFANRDLFATSLNHYVLPWVQSLTFLPDTEHRIIAGGSLGGLAAAELCRYRPDIAQCATVQSASWWWNDLSSDIIEGIRLVDWKKADATPPNINLFVEVGAYEGYLLSWNRAFREVLREQGIAHTYREYSGGHDYACWSRGIIDSLRYFTQK